MGTLFLIVLRDLVGFGFVIPLLPFSALHFGAAPLALTALMAAFSFAQFFAAPFWGRMSDRIGRKPVLLSSLAASALSYIWLGVATILAAMGVPAFGFSCLNPAVTSLVSREADGDERGGILGVNQSGQSLARISGPLTAGAGYGAAGRNAPYYLGALIMAGVVAMTAGVPRACLPEKESVQ